MDCSKTGNIIKKLRIENNMTQRMLADKMNISDKTVSKWERGLGCPDMSLIAELAEILEIDISRLLKGCMEEKSFINGNMKKSMFYVCPHCGNISVCTGEASIYCCGKKLSSICPKKAASDQMLTIEKCEDDYYITSSEQMNKSDYISFLAFITSDKINIIKLYPEWELSVRIPKREHGTLLWYSVRNGLLSMYI